MNTDSIAYGYVPPKDNFPFPSPFSLTSVENDWCKGDLSKIIHVKRTHLQKNLDVIAEEIGMSQAGIKHFLDWWCDPMPGTSEIRAEGDPYFNLRRKAENWVRKHPEARIPATAKKEEDPWAKAYRNKVRQEMEEAKRNGTFVPTGNFNFRMHSVSDEDAEAHREKVRRQAEEILRRNEQKGI